MRTFEELFTGKTSAFGRFVLEDKVENKIKRGGKATTVKAPVTPELHQQHLDGSQGLGIVPINDQNMCVFGALDVDDYGKDIVALNREVRRLEYSHELLSKEDEITKLPLVVCRTKSGGAHLYMFCKPTDASIVRETLKSFAIALGLYPLEIFPKQKELKDGDVGNWINLPYFNADETDRYALDANGDPLSLNDFVAYANEMIVSDVAPLILNDGPPCLQQIAAEGFPEGMRNTTMLNVGMYLKLKNSDNWDAKLEDFNAQRLGKGHWLSSSEILALQKSLKSKDYQFQCKDPALESRCQRSICETRKFGVSPNAPAMSLKGLPSDAIVLPGDVQSITAGGREVFASLDADGTYIRRTNFVYRIDYEAHEMELVGPEELRSRIETAGQRGDGTRTTWRASTIRLKTQYKQDIANISECRAMLASPAMKQLTNVKGVSASPIILSNGHVVTSGIHNDVLMLCNQEFTKIPVEEARDALLDLLRDYQFRSGGDKSRCVAAMISPLLRTSGLIGGHAPIWVMEADQSHAGKSKLAKIVFAMYGDNPTPVVTKDRDEGGVGGLTELIANAFLKAKNFVFIDNLRTDGAFQNAYLEAAVTQSGMMPVRVPYAGLQDIDVSRTSVVITANDLSLNRDLANRANMVMIEKQDDDHNFHDWGQTIEDYVRANRVFYFNCVASIVQNWILTHDTRQTDASGMQHDLREWACKIDYICREVLDLAPPFYSYRQVQTHKVNTEMTWLEDFCEAIEVNDGMSTQEMLDNSEFLGVKPPVETAKKLGFVLRRLLKGNPSVTVLGRFEFELTRDWDEKKGRTRKVYSVRATL